MQHLASRGFIPSSVPQTVHHCPLLSSLLRITLTLACPMDLKNFPMDVQTCIMQLESCESHAPLHFQERQRVSPLPFPCLLHPHLQLLSCSVFTGLSLYGRERRVGSFGMSLLTVHASGCSLSALFLSLFLPTSPSTKTTQSPASTFSANASNKVYN